MWLYNFFLVLVIFISCNIEHHECKNIKIHIVNSEDNLSIPEALLIIGIDTFVCNLDGEHTFLSCEFSTLVEVQAVGYFTYKGSVLYKDSVSIIGLKGAKLKEIKVDWSR